MALRDEEGLPAQQATDIALKDGRADRPADSSPRLKSPSRPLPESLTSLIRGRKGAAPLDRLTPFGWCGGLVYILAFSLASFLLCGYFLAYWRNADMDFMVVYSALALNDGARRAFFDHPAYLTILSVEGWFCLLHQFHLLDAWRLSAIPSASDTAAFDAAMTSAIRAGRIVAFLTAGGLILAFAGLARRIVTDVRIATCAVFAFAISGSVQMHLRVLRSEMIAASFCILALMIAIMAARRATIWRPLALAAAAALCVLGLENKVQAILLIAALPALVLPFGAGESASLAYWRDGPRAWLGAAAAIVIALVALAAALPLIATGLDPATAAGAGLKPLLLGRFGVYQAALLVWSAFAMIAFAAIRRVSAAETVAAIAAVIAGASLALLALKIQYDVNDAVIVMNPIEKMMMYADTPEAGGSVSGAIGLLVSGLLGVLGRYSFVLYPSPRPAVFLVWLVVPGVVHAWRRGERQVALQAALLMCAAIGIDAIGIRRGLKVEYFIFTDPLVILAGMVLLDSLKDIQMHRFAFPIGAALIALHTVISQAEPVKLALKQKGPETVCEWNSFYLPTLPLPWCTQPPRG
jgi:hypothetical protein